MPAIQKPGATSITAPSYGDISERLREFIQKEVGPYLQSKGRTSLHPDEESAFKEMFVSRLEGGQKPGEPVAQGISRPKSRTFQESLVESVNNLLGGMAGPKREGPKQPVLTSGAKVPRNELASLTTPNPQEAAPGTGKAAFDLSMIPYTLGENVLKAARTGEKSDFEKVGDIDKGGPVTGDEAGDTAGSLALTLFGPGATMKGINAAKGLKKGQLLKRGGSYGLGKKAEQVAVNTPTNLELWLQRYLYRSPVGDRVAGYAPDVKNAATESRRQKAKFENYFLEELAKLTKATATGVPTEQHWKDVELPAFRFLLGVPTAQDLQNPAARKLAIGLEEKLFKGGRTELLQPEIQTAFQRFQGTAKKPGRVAGLFNVLDKKTGVPIDTQKAIARAVSANAGRKKVSIDELRRAVTSPDEVMVVKAGTGSNVKLAPLREALNLHGVTTDYLKQVGRARFDYPVWDQFMKSIGKLQSGSGARQELHDYVLNFLGDSKAKSILAPHERELVDKVQKALYTGSLGLNPGSALTNLTQLLNLVADQGLWPTIREFPGFAKDLPSMYKKGKFTGDVAHKVGALHNVPGLEAGVMEPGAWQKYSEPMMYLFNTSEGWDRELASRVGKHQAALAGKSARRPGGQFNRWRMSPQDRAAADVADRTMFSYASDNPFTLNEGPLGKLSTMFLSYPGRQISFMASLAQKEALNIAKNFKQGNLVEAGLGAGRLGRLFAVNVAGYGVPDKVGESLDIPKEARGGLGQWPGGIIPYKAAPLQAAGSEYGLLLNRLWRGEISPEDFALRASRLATRMFVPGASTAWRAWDRRNEGARGIAGAIVGESKPPKPKKPRGAPNWRQYAK